MSEGRKAVLFDLDGTLTDPKTGITRCIRHALEELGYSCPSLEALHWCIGPPLRESFQVLLNCKNDEALLQRAIRAYRDRFATVGLFENELYSGIPELLSHLRSSGYKTFVATSKPTIYASQILSFFHLEGLFERVYGSELDGTRSQKAELIAHAAEIECLTAKNTLMVGDREHDVRGAAACGIRSIGVSYGYGTTEELLNSGAIAVASSPTEIAALIMAHA